MTTTTAPAVTIESTTGTAPIRLTARTPDPGASDHYPGDGPLVSIALEDGSAQVYRLADLAAAVEQLVRQTLTRDLERLQHAGEVDPTTPTVRTVDAAAQHLHGAPQLIADNALRAELVRTSAKQITTEEPTMTTTHTGPAWADPAATITDPTDGSAIHRSAPSVETFGPLVVETALVDDGTGPRLFLAVDGEDPASLRDVDAALGHLAALRGRLADAVS